MRRAFPRVSAILVLLLACVGRTVPARATCRAAAACPPSVAAVHPVGVPLDQTVEALREALWQIRVDVVKGLEKVRGAEEPAPALRELLTTLADRRAGLKSRGDVEALESDLSALDADLEGKRARMSPEGYQAARAALAKRSAEAARLHVDRDNLAGNLEKMEKAILSWELDYNEMRKLDSAQARNELRRKVAASVAASMPALQGR